MPSQYLEGGADLARRPDLQVKTRDIAVGVELSGILLQAVWIPKKHFDRALGQYFQV